MIKTQDTKGFSLVEILISLVVFGLVMAAAGGAFYGIYNEWRRQRNYLECVENARWAMEFMSNEIKGGGSFTVVSSDTAQFDLPTGERVWYWRGDGGTYGETRIIYRGVGAGFGAANGNRQELANFIVPNPSGNNTFTDAGGGLYAIELTTRPNPAAPVGEGNRNYALRTRVRPRN